jgi:predicted MFS family arabinose efflux permease
MTATFRTKISTLFAGFNDPRIVALGVTQTIGYGTLYYAYGVLAPAISQDFGIGLDWFFAVFTLGLLLGGFAAPLVGREIDRKGARTVMVAGSVAATLSLVACAVSPTIWTFTAAVVMMEVAACLVLYEAAFAGLTQMFRHDARQRITAISLIAGFASTIFWPLSQWLLLLIGWRWTFGVFALAHLVVCAPLHWAMLKEALPIGDRPKGETSADDEPVVLEGADRKRALIFYTAAICISGIVYSSFPVHMLRIIENEGFTPQAAALVAMVMGPAQVIARIVEISAGQRFDAITTGRVALGALVACTLLLIATNGWTPGAVLFAALYGVSQGLITIARGTVPLQLFGVRGYATLVGKVTGLRFVVNAFGPFLFAFAATQLGIGMAIALNGVAAFAAFLAFMALRRPGI